MAFIERLVSRLNDLAGARDTVIMLATRGEIDATLAVLDAGRLALEHHAVWLACWSGLIFVLRAV